MALVTSDGTFYVSSFRDGLTTGTVDIYRVPLENGAYKTATNISHEYNAGGQSYADLDAIVSSDDRVMIFSSFGRPDTYGSADLYVTYRKNGKWQPAHHLKAPFNTPERDYSPRFSPDGAYILLFERAARCDRASNDTAELRRARKADPRNSEWWRQYLSHQPRDARLRGGQRTGVRAEVIPLSAVLRVCLDRSVERPVECLGLIDHHEVA